MSPHRPLLLAALLGAAACGGAPAPEEGGWQHLGSQRGLLVGEFLPTPDPPVVGRNALEAAVLDGAGGPLAGALVEVVPWMPGHGHGTPVVPVVEELGEGRYAIGDVVLTMPGRWELQVDVTAVNVMDRFVVELDVR